MWLIVPHQNNIKYQLPPLSKSVSKNKIKNQDLQNIFFSINPLENIQNAIEHGHMAIEIVDLPLKTGGFSINHTLW